MGYCKYRPECARIHFRRNYQMVNFINLYQDLFVYDKDKDDWLFSKGYEIHIHEDEYDFKYELVVYIWAKDWTQIKKDLQIKRTNVQYERWKKKNVYCFK